VRGPLIVLAVVAAFNALVLGELGIYGRNTLERHPEWFLGKVLVQRQPFGASECRVSRNLMAQNRLNLDAWYGSQELYYNRVLQVDRVRFRFRLAEKAYVCFVVRTREGFRGVCLSRRADVPTSAFDADDGCGFRQRQPLALAVEGGWHRCEVTADSVAVDGEAVKLPLPVLGEGVYGFRGSTAAAQVDDVELGDVVREDFRNDRHAGVVWVLALALVVLVSLVVFLLNRARRRTVREALLWTLLANLVLAGVLVSALLFDYVFWSKQHNFYEPAEDFRRRRLRIFDRVDPILSAGTDTVRPFLAAPPAATAPDYHRYRVQVHRDGAVFELKDELEDILAYRRTYPRAKRSVLFLGSSQTWGEGAYRDDEGMVSRAAQLLGPDAEVINGARQGTNSVEVRHRYTDHLYHFQPDLVVINLSNNDNSPEEFAENLKLIHEFNRNQGVPTLFVLEANNPENPPDGLPHLESKHKVMRELAAQLRVPLVDLHAFLQEPADFASGFLWWDNVHPSSQGHKLAGRFLAEEVLREWQKPRP